MASNTAFVAPSPQAAMNDIHGKYSATYLQRRLGFHGSAERVSGVYGTMTRDLAMDAMAETTRHGNYAWAQTQRVPLRPMITYSFVRTSKDLATLLLHLQTVVTELPGGKLVGAHGRPDDVPEGMPTLFVGLVGDRVGRFSRGSLSMMTIFVSSPALRHLFVVDAIALGGADMLLDTVVSWTVGQDQLRFCDPLTWETRNAQNAVAMGQWPGLDGTCFAPVEVALSQVLPIAACAFYTPWTAMERRPQYRESGRTQMSLRRILEAGEVPKVFFDARHAADMLLERHNLRLRGVIDLQLVEIAARPLGAPVDRVCSLEVCLRKACCMPPPVMSAWAKVRQDGRRQFQHWDEIRSRRQQMQGQQLAEADTRAPFNKRPLDITLLRYAINNVLYLPSLLDLYRPCVNPCWLPSLAAEMAVRVVCVRAARKSKKRRGNMSHAGSTSSSEGPANSNSPIDGPSPDTSKNNTPEYILPGAATTPVDMTPESCRSPWTVAPIAIPHPDHLPFYCTQQDAEEMDRHPDRHRELREHAERSALRREATDVTRPSASARKRWNRKIKGAV